MNTGLLIAILVAVVIVVLLAVLLARRRRTQRLQQQFGPEYQRTVARAGDQPTAESDLAAREQRRRALDIVALEPAAQARYLEAWRADPRRAPVSDTQNNPVPSPQAHGADVLVRVASGNRQ